MQRFKALVASKGDKGPDIAWKELGDGDLMDGDVLVRVSHSTVNYKDGLALTGKAPVIRRWPMIPGIDFAGTVLSSSHGAFKAGDAVILNGWGCGETHLGGYAQVARVKGDWLVPKPAAFTAAETMAIGTAGYTAMLCVLALERNGVTPAQGPVVVTGAAGGVGSVAIALLAKLGYQVIASTGRAGESRLPQGPRRQRDHRPRRIVGAGQAARQGALGGRHRRGRQPHAGQRAEHDQVRRRRCRVRPGAGHGPHDVGGALHPARRDAGRHRLGDGAEARPPRSLEPPGARSRQGQAGMP